jgi:hypothetical protein
MLGWLSETGDSWELSSSTERGGSVGASSRDRSSDDSERKACERRECSLYRFCLARAPSGLGLGPGTSFRLTRRRGSPGGKRQPNDGIWSLCCGLDGSGNGLSLPTPFERIGIALPSPTLEVFGCSSSLDPSIGGGVRNWCSVSDEGVGACKDCAVTRSGDCGDSLDGVHCFGGTAGGEGTTVAASNSAVVGAKLRLTEVTFPGRAREESNARAVGLRFSKAAMRDLTETLGSGSNAW